MEPAGTMSKRARGSGLFPQGTQIGPPRRGPTPWPAVQPRINTNFRVPQGRFDGAPNYPYGGRGTITRKPDATPLKYRTMHVIAEAEEEGKISKYMEPGALLFSFRCASNVHRSGARTRSAGGRDIVDIPEDPLFHTSRVWTLTQVADWAAENSHVDDGKGGGLKMVTANGMANRFQFLGTQITASEIPVLFELHMQAAKRTSIGITVEHKTKTPNIWCNIPHTNGSVVGLVWVKVDLPNAAMASVHKAAGSAPPATRVGQPRPAVFCGHMVYIEGKNDRQYMRSSMNPVIIGTVVHTSDGFGGAHDVLSAIKTPSSVVSHRVAMSELPTITLNLGARRL